MSHLVIRHKSIEGNTSDLLIADSPEPFVVAVIGTETQWHRSLETADGSHTIAVLLDAGAQVFVSGQEVQ